jgi:group I intron endonuclease
LSSIYRIVIVRPDGPDAFYIGQARDFSRRRSDHLRALRGARHANPRLQNLFNKHGEIAFRFEALLICAPVLATEYEQLVLDSYIARFGRDVINIRRECVISSAGVKFSDATRAKLSAAKKGKPGRRWTPEQKAKISATKKGVPRKPETIEAHRRAITGKTFSEETRRKMSLAWKGRTISAETRARMSESAKARKRKNYVTEAVERIS